MIMQVSNSTPLTSSVLLAGVLATFVLLLISSRRYRLPPGPPGNVAAEFKKSPMPVLFDRWRKQYGTPQSTSNFILNAISFFLGPIFSFKVGRRLAIGMVTKHQSYLMVSTRHSPERHQGYFRLT